MLKVFFDSMCFSCVFRSVDIAGNLYTKDCINWRGSDQFDSALNERVKMDFQFV